MCFHIVGQLLWILRDCEDLRTKAVHRHLQKKRKDTGQWLSGSKPNPGVFNTDTVYHRGYWLLLPADNSLSGGSKYHHKALPLFCVASLLRSGSIRFYCPPARHWGRCCPLNFPFPSTALVVTEALSDVVVTSDRKHASLTLVPSPTRKMLAYSKINVRPRDTKAQQLQVEQCENVSREILRQMNCSKSVLAS